MELLDAIIIAIVEGATEFLPVSSTGHMILASNLLGLENTDFLKSFEIFIQLGAISAIVLLYSRRFLKDIEIYKKLIVAFIPAAVIGFFAYDYIVTYLFNTTVVVISLIVGGIILIILDQKLPADRKDYEDTNEIPYKRAIYIGLFQCLAMVPGVSRAAATIIGGMVNGFNRTQAAEFSFLLAVPTMIAASGYDLLKSDFAFTQDQLILLAVGFVVAFVFAWIFVLLMLRIINKMGFTVFGIYRIFIGLLFLFLAQKLSLGD
jgi:undecaprenyl-diphosphatase